MRLLVTTNARLYKAPDGTFWTPMVYDYDFFLRYLDVFEEVKLVAHVKDSREATVTDMVRVDGPNLSVYEVPFPNGKIEYLRMYHKIDRSLRGSFWDCDAAVLRIPDQLAFQLYAHLYKNRIPVGVEVTSNSWEFFAPAAVKSRLRPLLRLWWDYQQKHVCRTALGTAYVTKSAIQERYPPIQAVKNIGFTTSYTNANIDSAAMSSPRRYTTDKRRFTAIHVSGSICGYAKGHKELIEAIGMLVDQEYDIDLVLVGAGLLEPDILSLIDKYKLERRIRYTGRISSASQIYKELRNADIFVFPSYREGLPRVVVEAMACGLPCISTRIPGVMELLDSTCLVPPRDSISLMNKIREFLRDPALMTEQSRINVIKSREYSMDYVSKKREAYYTKIKQMALRRKGESQVRGY